MEGLVASHSSREYRDEWGTVFEEGWLIRYRTQNVYSKMPLK